MYSYDFSKMVQTNTTTGFTRTIKRVPAAPPSPVQAPIPPVPSSVTPPAVPLSASLSALQLSVAEEATAETVAKEKAAFLYQQRVLNGPIILRFEGESQHIKKSFESLNICIKSTCK